MPRSIPTGGAWQRLGLLVLFSAAVLLSGCEIGTDASGPQCWVMPSALQFGTVQVGSHEDLSFVVKNEGTGVLYGTVSEASDDYSIQAGGEAFSLGADETHLVTVRFSPIAHGARTGSIDLGSDQCSRVNCAGTGSQGPLCDVEPTSLDFGIVALGSYVEKSFHIRNLGGGVVSGYVSTSFEHYSIVSGGGTFDLVFGQTQTATVRFEPTSVGVKTAGVNTGSECAQVACTGVGRDGPICVIIPPELFFGSVVVGAYVDRTFVIENIGSGTLTGFVHLTCGGYSILSGDGEFSLDSQETRTVVVRFSPTTTGVQTCTVHTEASDCSDVPCSGTGIDP